MTMTQALKKKGYNEAKNLNKILTNFKQLPCIVASNQGFAHQKKIK